jgi:integrase
MRDSTTAVKVSKPRPDFPLYAHATGRWAKKVCGKLHYFGKTADDPKGEKALDLWLDQKDELLAGRTPHIGTTIKVAEIVNQFLAHKEELLNAGEITQRTFAEYEATGKRVASAFGRLTPVDALVAVDFRHLRASIAKDWGPVRLGNEIQRVRSIFKYAYDSGLIDKPPRFGADFKKPSRKVLRLNRAKNGPRMFEASEIRAIFDKCGPILRAMVLLGTNGGLGNADVANLPTSAVDLDHAWLNYPRIKTGIDRRIPLWAETVTAIREAIRVRPKHKTSADAGILFITKHGHRWCKAEAIPDPETKKIVSKVDDAVSKEFAKVLKELEIVRRGLGFFALRHTFETIGGDSRDQVATDAIMGHVRDDMASAYRERVDDERLKAVVNHVHAWLFEVEIQGGTK